MVCVAGGLPAPAGGKPGSDGHHRTGQQAERWPSLGESYGLSPTGSFRGLGWEAASSGWGGALQPPDCLPLGRAWRFENLFSERGGKADGRDTDLLFCSAWGSPLAGGGLRGPLPGLAFSSFTRLTTWLLGKMKLDGRWKVFVKGKNLIYLQGKSSCFLAF